MKTRPLPTDPTPVDDADHRLGSEYMDARTYLRLPPRQPVRQAGSSADDSGGANASLFVDESLAHPDKR